MASIRYLLGLSLFCSILACNGENQTTYDHVFSTITLSENSSDHGDKVIRTSAGNIVIGAVINSKTALIKLNLNLDSIWVRKYDSQASEIDLVEEENGFLMLTRHTAGVTLSKTDSNGDTLWSRNFDGSFWGSIAQAQDNACLIATTNNNQFKANDVHLVSISDSGIVRWTKTYDLRNGQDDDVWSVASVSGDGFIIGGNIGVYDGIHYSMLLRINSMGDTLWTKIYNEGDNEAVINTSDGGFAFVGDIFESSNGYVSSLTKVNSTGEIQWQKTYGSGRLFDLHETQNGYFLIGGNKIIRVDKSGEILWIEESGIENRSITDLQSDTYVIVGYGLQVMGIRE